MNVGERVICIKDMGTDTYLPELLYFKKGEIYRITEFHKTGLYSIRGREYK
jgi:hypothetical protein